MTTAPTPRKRPRTVRRETELSSLKVPPRTKGPRVRTLFLRVQCDEVETAVTEACASLEEAGFGSATLRVVRVEKLLPRRSPWNVSRLHKDMTANVYIVSIAVRTTTARQRQVLARYLGRNDAE